MDNENCFYSKASIVFLRLQMNKIKIFIIFSLQKLCLFMFRIEFLPVSENVPTSLSLTLSKERNFCSFILFDLIKNQRQSLLLKITS